MARKRRRARRKKSSTSLMAAPRRRRRHYLSTSPKRKGRRRKRGLSELGLVKGKMGTIANPIIEGAMGGVGAQLIRKFVPETIFTSNPTLAPYEKWIKGGLLIAGAAVAANMKQPLIAAGMAGGAAILVMQSENILQEDAPHGGFAAGRFSRGRFASPNLLASSRLLSDRKLLSENIYPTYDPMYESPKHEFRF